MQQQRTPRWRRHAVGRRQTVHRMLLAGALVGVAAAIVAQPFLGGVNANLRPLVRAAFVLPALVFVAWWLFGPGYAVGADELDTEPQLAEEEMSMDARAELIEQSFASTFGAEERPSASGVDADAKLVLSSSVRRRGVVSHEVRAEYGLSSSRVDGSAQSG